MALLTNAPPPLSDPIASPQRPEYRGQDPQAGMVTRPWVDWFNNMLTNQEKAGGRIATVVLSQQDASGITTTDIPTTQPLTAGLYALKYYLRLERVDGLSSDIQPIFKWTCASVSRQYDGASISANLLAQTGTAYVLLRVDNNTTVTYETIVSMGSGDGFYALDIVLDEVDA